MEYKGHHITDKKKIMTFSLKVDEPFKYYVHEGVGSGFLNETEVVRLVGELKKVKRAYANPGDVDGDVYFKVKHEYGRIAGCYELTFIPCYSRSETDEERDARIEREKEYWDGVENNNKVKEEKALEKQRAKEKQEEKNAVEFLLARGYNVSKIE